MDYLLDTHTVLWLAENASQLSDTAKQAIFDTDKKKYVSIASAWEVAIKCSLGKLEIEGGTNEFFRILDENGFILLPVEREYVECVQSLPFIHRDPFDRMIIASALSERLCLVTADESIHAYNVPYIW